MKNRISQYRYSDDPDEQDSFAEEYAEVCDAAGKGMTNGDFDIGGSWVEAGKIMCSPKPVAPSWERDPST